MEDKDWLSFREKAIKTGTVIEEVIREFYENWLNTSDSAIDGGAHAGYHTIPLAKHLKTGKVVGIDANKAMFDKLSPLLEPFPNAVLEYAALQNSYDEESVTFHCSLNHPGRSGISRSWDYIQPGSVNYEPPVTVPATTIDKLALKHNLQSLRFVKLDLEGGEFNALRGAQTTLSEARPVFVTEYSSHAPQINNFTMEEYYKFLSSFNYVVMAPNGSLVTASNPFPFWYVFIIPSEYLDDVREIVLKAVCAKI